MGRGEIDDRDACRQRGKENFEQNTRPALGCLREYLGGGIPDFSGCVVHIVQDDACQLDAADFLADVADEVFCVKRVEK